MVDIMNNREILDLDDPAAALATVVSMRRMANRLELAAVQAAIDSGWSWARVAEALGVTPQAAHKRLSRRVTRPGKDDQ